MKEKILIIFVASVIGLLITTIAFYIYQTTRPQKNDKKVENPIAQKNPEQPTSEKPSTLIIETPQDEMVSDRRTIEIKGKTSPMSTIVVSSNSEDSVGKASSDGSFALTVSIDAGLNKLITRSISPLGESIEDERVVTYTSEEF